MRVDIVITWVNGSDPEWRRKKFLHENGHLTNTLFTSNVDGRYRDNGELKYLLRSIDMYWPFEGNIYIVTDNQVPDFINSNKRIKIIDHMNILDKEYLPTFSSRCIESALHKIEGISEHFVAFNDDVYLSRPVTFEDFFGTKGCRVYLTNEKIPEGTTSASLSGHNSALNAKFWMIEKYGRSTINHIPEHFPKGIKKSWMSELEEKHPDVFHEIRTEKFRRIYGQSILANLYQDWCLTLGRGDIRYNECLYLYTDDVENRDVSQELKNALGTKLSVFINDTTDNRNDLEMLQSRLDQARDKCFPRESSFEKAPRRRMDAELRIY